MESLAYSYLALNHEENDGEIPPCPFILEKAILEQISLLSLSLLLSVTMITPSLAATIQEGDRGSHVIALQTFLREQGYLPATPTGYYDSMTKTAVIRYQKAQGLVPDGVVGQATVNSFCRYSKSLQKLAVNSNPTTQKIQKELELVGYDLNYSPPLVSLPVMVTETQQKVEVTESTLSYTYAVPTLPAPVAQTPRPEILTLGSQGEKVKQLQQRLQILGYYSGEITGYYGEQTREAVIQLQRDRALPADGIVGANTFATLSRPLVQEGIRDLQQRLQVAGFYSGEVDGLWGPRTQQALEAAQRAYGIRTSDLQK